MELIFLEYIPTVDHFLGRKRVSVPGTLYPWSLRERIPSTNTATQNRTLCFAIFWRQETALFFFFFFFLGENISSEGGPHRTWVNLHTTGTKGEGAVLEPKMSLTGLQVSKTTFLCFSMFFFFSRIGAQKRS